jgi:hypothetical protein
MKRIKIKGKAAGQGKQHQLQKLSTSNTTEISDQKKALSSGDEVPSRKEDTVAMDASSSTHPPPPAAIMIPSAGYSSERDNHPHLQMPRPMVLYKTTVVGDAAPFQMLHRSYSGGRDQLSLQLPFFPARQTPYQQQDYHRSPAASLGLAAATSTKNSTNNSSNNSAASMNNDQWFEKLEAAFVKGHPELSSIPVDPYPPQRSNSVSSVLDDIFDDLFEPRPFLEEQPEAATSNARPAAERSQSEEEEEQPHSRHQSANGDHQGQRANNAAPRSSSSGANSSSGARALFDFFRR